MWLDGAAITMYYLPFNIAHFLLAEKYGKIQKRVPVVLDHKKETKETTCDGVWYWILLVSNIIAAPFYGLANTFYYTVTEVD